MSPALRSAASLLFAVALASCSSDTPVKIQSPETIPYDSSLEIDLTTMTRSATDIYSKDLTVGTGTEAANGDTLDVRYGGYLNNGLLFDYTDPAAVFTFVLGDKEVIPGWEQGVPGMRVGGRRLLIIPPALAYGNAGVGQVPGGAVVIFSIDLIAVRKGAGL